MLAAICAMALLRRAGSWPLAVIGAIAGLALMGVLGGLSLVQLIAGVPAAGAGGGCVDLPRLVRMGQRPAHAGPGRPQRRPGRCNHRTGAFQRYVATAEDAHSAVQACESTIVTVTSCTVAGLINGNPYTVTVVAVGADGTSLGSAAVPAVSRAMPSGVHLAATGAAPSRSAVTCVVALAIGAVALLTSVRAKRNVSDVAARAGARSARRSGRRPRIRRHG